jgi:hypothetical protein
MPQFKAMVDYSIKTGEVQLAGCLQNNQKKGIISLVTEDDHDNGKN